MESIERLAGKIEELNKLIEYISTHKFDNNEILRYLSSKVITFSLEMQAILKDMEGDNHE